MYYVRLDTPRECNLPGGETGVTIAAYARKTGDSEWIMVETFRGKLSEATIDADTFANILEADEVTRNEYLNMSLN